MKLPLGITECGTCGAKASDAARLNTALAALESAEPLLEALADEGLYVDSVAEALAAVRAAREGREP